MARPRPEPPNSARRWLSARQNRSNARVRSVALMPGPLSVTWRSTSGESSSGPGAGRPHTRMVPPRPPMASRALATRLSTTCDNRSGSARTHNDGGASVLRATWRSSANGCHIAMRSARKEPTSSGAATTRSPRSTRARASRPSTMRANRSTSVIAASTSSRACSATSGSRFSSRSRSPVRGVRNWCEASATNASCEAMTS